MLGLRLSWEDEREKHNSWKRPRACGTLRFHELCFSLSSSHESRKPNIHFLILKEMQRKSEKMLANNMFYTHFMQP